MNPMPGRPTLRSARLIEVHAARTSIGSQPRTTSTSFDSISFPAAASQYV